jgi:Transposase, Mutator family
MQAFLHVPRQESNLNRRIKSGAQQIRLGAVEPNSSTDSRSALLGSRQRPGVHSRLQRECSTPLAGAANVASSRSEPCPPCGLSLAPAAPTTFMPVEDEFDAWLGRAGYERRPEYQRGLRTYDSGLRNGFRARTVQTAQGELQVEIPQVREAAETFASKLFPRGTKLV